MLKPIWGPLFHEAFYSIVPKSGHFYSLGKGLTRIFIVPVSFSLAEAFLRLLSEHLFLSSDSVPVFLLQFCKSQNLVVKCVFEKPRLLEIFSFRREVGGDEIAPLSCSPISDVTGSSPGVDKNSVNPQPFKIPGFRRKISRRRKIQE